MTTYPAKSTHRGTRCWRIRWLRLRPFGGRKSDELQTCGRSILPRRISRVERERRNFPRVAVSRPPCTQSKVSCIVSYDGVPGTLAGFTTQDIRPNHAACFPIRIHQSISALIHDKAKVLQKQHIRTDSADKVNGSAPMAKTWCDTGRRNRSLALRRKLLIGIR